MASKLKEGLYDENTGEFEPEDIFCFPKGTIAKATFLNGLPKKGTKSGYHEICSLGTLCPLKEKDWIFAH